MVIPAHHLAGNRTNRSTMDFYETPSSATHSLMKRIKFNGLIWECACGDGAMSKVLEQYNPVIASDITMGVDFFQAKIEVPNIVTNPPYKLAEQFVRKANQLATEKVVMFLRLNFLESQSRYKMFKELPLEWVLVFSKRQNLYPKGMPNSAGGVIAYAWFVWNKSYTGRPQIDWIND